MSSRGKLLMAIYAALATPMALLGFAGLFSRKMGLQIPLVSTEIIPALHKHAVWGETLRGPAILLGGEDWFFLIILGVIIVLAVAMGVVNKLLQAVEGKNSDKRRTARK